MATYTVDVAKIVDAYSGRQFGDFRNGNIQVYIKKSLDGIFNFDFPVEAYDNARMPDDKQLTDAQIAEINKTVRTNIEYAIIDHYYNYEIAFETVGRWRQALESKLNDVMPYYNEMFQIQADKIAWNNALSYRATKDYEHTGNTDVQGESVFGDFPNAKVSDGYATNKTETADKTDTKVVDYTEEKRYGSFIYNPFDLQKKAYDNIKNIYLMIAEEMKDLFYFTVDLDGGYSL